MSLILIFITGGILSFGYSLTKPISDSAKFDISISDKSYQKKIDKYLLENWNYVDRKEIIPNFKNNKLKTEKPIKNKIDDYLIKNREFLDLLENIKKGNNKNNYRDFEPYKDKDGYLRFKHNNKLVSRFVMEGVIGRKLRREEVVHHDDGQKLNNEPYNLILFENQYKHHQYHLNNKHTTGNWYGIVTEKINYEKLYTEKMAAS